MNGFKTFLNKDDFVKPKKPRKPLYSIKDLAEVLKITPNCLTSRINDCEEKPIPVGKNHRLSRAAKSAILYDKDEFLAWYKRNYSKLEKK